jgi:hypothetical protein
MAALVAGRRGTAILLPLSRVAGVGESASGMSH